MSYGESKAPGPCVAWRNHKSLFNLLLLDRRLPCRCVDEVLALREALAVEVACEHDLAAHLAIADLRVVQEDVVGIANVPDLLRPNEAEASARIEALDHAIEVADHLLFILATDTLAVVALAVL